MFAPNGTFVLERPSVVRAVIVLPLWQELSVATATPRYTVNASTNIPAPCSSEVGPTLLYAWIYPRVRVLWQDVPFSALTSLATRRVVGTRLRVYVGRSTLPSVSACCQAQ